jgi:hypothetical protein
VKFTLVKSVVKRIWSDSFGKRAVLILRFQKAKNFLGKRFYIRREHLYLRSLLFYKRCQMRYLRFQLLYQSTQIRILCLKIWRISLVHEILIYYVIFWNDRGKWAAQRLFLESLRC